MRIQVTAKDIKNGSRLACSRCPVALAVKRVVKCFRVSVGADVLTVYYGPEGTGAPYNLFVLPSIAKNFIRMFDIGLPVSPIEFDLLPNGATT